MRTPNDKKLASEVHGIDLILGGHDHVSVEIDINCLIKKSGTDFMELSHLTLRQGDPQDDDFCYHENTGVAAWFEKAYTNKDVEPDPEL